MYLWETTSPFNNVIKLLSDIIKNRARSNKPMAMDKDVKSPRKATYDNLADR